MKKILLTICGLIIGFSLLTLMLKLTTHKPSLDAKKLQIVCTTTMITDAVKAITQDLASVKGLMGPGVDPHLYKARESDMHTLASAHIIFYNGLHLEGKMTDIFEKMKERTITVAVTNGIDHTRLQKTPFENLYDPHVWFDVTLWISVVKNISNALCLHDPKHADTYEKNTTAYVEQLTNLDNEIRASIETIRPEQRILVTAHDAFSYFGQAYGFVVLGLQGVSTESEPGTKDIDSLASIIVSKRIKAIFIETSIPEQSIRAVKQAVAAAGWNVILGDPLYSDALGASDGPGGTYIDMVRYNVQAIVKALQ